MTLADRERVWKFAADAIPRCWEDKKSASEEILKTIKEFVADAVATERIRAARIARESVADDLAEKFPDARRLAEQIAADIEGDQK